MIVPTDAVIAGYYYQAINADAPHPAAARLWQEFLYADERPEPVARGWRPPGPRRGDEDGGHARRRVQPPRCRRSSGTPIVPTQADAESGKTYLAANWANAVG